MGFFIRKILGVVTVGRIIARIVGGLVTTDSAISEIMYKSFTKVCNSPCSLYLRTGINLHQVCTYGSESSHDI